MNIRSFIPHRHNWIIIAWWYNGGQGEGGTYGGNDEARCSFCKKEIKL